MMYNKTWREDIGIDELEDNLFTKIIFDAETGETVCSVFGKTLEELQLNVDRILETNLII